MFRSELKPTAAPAHILLTLAVATAPTSCETESPPGHPTRETLPNGGILVRYPGLPAIDSAGPELTEAQIDLQFGSVEGDDPNLLFGDIRGIQAASDGTIYVLDFAATEVRAYDPDGRYLRTVARRGEGPGEITAANGIFLVADTLLWMHDHGKWTVIGVDPAGNEVGRFQKPVLSYSYIWTAVFDEQGRYWKQTSHSDEELRYPPPAGLSSTTRRRYYKSYDLASGAIDSVFLSESSVRSYHYQDSNGLWQLLAILFQSGERILVNPAGGFWRANTASYRIAQTDETGDTLVVIDAGMPTLPVTDEDRSGFVERFVESRGPEIRDELEEVAALMPDVKPILADMFVDDEGVLWVERVKPPGAPALYDRFSQDGDYLGSVRFGFQPGGGLWIQHGNIYTWVVDDLDVPYVVRAPLSRRIEFTPATPSTFRDR
ncbi:MAG: 6-bladed beta-propeller [Gemmatimonadota bacterium]|nr:6-bladed beta-propeller [Gemmatimonadota bacterium]